MRSAPAPDHPTEAGYRPAFFAPEEWLFINAACARLIPADEHGPSAVELGVPQYIDRQMGTPWADGAIWYMQGPQNGRHKRMHLTLKKDATKPTGKNFLQQQTRFDAFTRVYNHERSHQALNMRDPAELDGANEFRSDPFNTHWLTWVAPLSSAHTFAFSTSCSDLAYSAVMFAGATSVVSKASCLCYRKRGLQLSEWSPGPSSVDIFLQSLSCFLVRARLLRREACPVWRRKAQV